MQNKFYKIFLAFSFLLIINSCTSEPNPPLTNGYVYLDKTFIELPDTAVLDISQTSMVTVTNVGKGYLLFNFDASATADTFSYTTSCKGILDVSETCNIFFQFAPNRVGEHSKDFKIINSADGSVTNISLKGKSIANNYEPATIPGLSINSNTVKFPEQATNTRSSVKEIEIRNITPNGITLNYSIDGSREDKEAFIVKSTCIQGNTLGALETCKFSIAFVPNKQKSFVASIGIETSPTAKVAIPISGSGIIQPKYPEQTGVFGLTVNTRNINYYEGNIDGKNNVRYLLFDNSNSTDVELKYANTATESFSLIYTGTTCYLDNVEKIITVPAGGSCNVAVNFLPKAATDFNDKVDFTYLNKMFTVTLNGRGQYVSSGVVFGYISPAQFSSTGASVLKTAIFLNNTPFAVKTSNITIKAFNPSNNQQLPDGTIFTLEDNASCENIILGPYQSCSLTVAFYVEQSVTPMPTPQAFRGEILINSAFGVAPLSKLTVTGSTSERDASSLITLSIPNIGNDIMISSATVGQKIYFYGGRFDDATTASLLRYYDFSTNTVVTLNPSGQDMVRIFGEKRPGYISSVNVMEYDGKLVIYGGRFRVNYTGKVLDPNKPDEDQEYNTHRDDDIYIYDPNDRTFSNDGAWRVVKAKSNGFTPEMMVGASSVIYNDKIYFFGGQKYDGKPIDESTRFKTYDLSRNEWENITSKIINLDDSYRSRVFSTATVFKDILYIYGGTSGLDNLINYNKNMYLINFADRTDTTVGSIVAYEPGGVTAGFGSMTGDKSNCLYRETGDVPQIDFGPCRPYRLDLVNGTDRIFTTTGIDNITTGGGIAGPWAFLPNIATDSGEWKNFESTYGIRFPAFSILTSIEGVITGIGGDKLYLFHVN